MTQPHRKKEMETQDHDQASLKGTLASVSVLGIIIVITWISLYVLFLNRL
ncbi:MAG: cytochrome c oxidase subunit 2A [Bacillus sp. (in: firmicutes)]